MSAVDGCDTVETSVVESSLGSVDVTVVVSVRVDGCESVVGKSVETVIGVNSVTSVEG